MATIPPCPETGPCQGAFTRDNLLQLWETIVDPSYSQQMLTLGEGSGSLEHITQAFQQLAAVSCAVDRSTQAMYILPHSGQTGNPAEGEQNACVLLKFERTKALTDPLVIYDVFAEENNTDNGEGSPTPVNTGRLYELKSAVVFETGNQGPIYVKAESEKPGYGYNYPFPGSIRSINQPSRAFSNVNATIVNEGGSWVLLCDNIPDVIVPEHVGQYVRIVTPSGERSYRIRGYTPPQPLATPPSGGGAVLDIILILEVAYGGTPIPGEMIIQPLTGAMGFILDTQIIGALLRVTISVRNGTFQLGASPSYNIQCIQSGASLFVDTGINPSIRIDYDSTPVAQGGVSWNILDWAIDLGVTVTNEASPSGGRLGILDELGKERGLPRVPGESDDSYRSRVATLADVVSPNAIRRVANRALSHYGLSGNLYEIGQTSFQGFYYDAPAPSYFAFDMDCAVMTGLVTGTFIEHEPVILNDTPDLLPLGTYGLAAGVFAGYDPSTGKIFIARTGLNPWDSAVTKYIVGRISGAYMQVTGFVVAKGSSQDALKPYMDYIEFRAFFMMGIPPTNLGDFGFFFDAGGYGFFDTAPFLTFFDGFPVNTAILQKTIWNDLNKAKAGGVGFDLYLDK